ncbi:MAG: hypothetical protein JW827_01135 [Spirochaetes bacterium]|nr:hypothetical protein [Spirochaetota bacterium]
MRRMISLGLAFVFMIVFSGCMAHQHVVGNGAQGGTEQVTKQWYILFGLVPLNDVDTKAMAGTAKNYTIETETSFVDFLISIVTGIVTIYPRSVTVKK